MKRRTKNTTGECLRCKKTFKRFKWDKQKFCSKTCYYLNKKIKTACKVCGKEKFYSVSMANRNKQFYCDRECYNKRFGNVKRIKRHTQYFDDMLNNASCVGCGIKEKYLLTIHHIDGNVNNNDALNHEIVCSNCHIKRHLKQRKRDGAWVYHTKSLTPRNIINQF